MCLLGKLLISRTSRLQTDKRRSNLDSGGPKTLRSVKIGLKLGLCKKKLTFPVDRALIGWWNELTIDISGWDNWQFWLHLNRSWFNGHNCATWHGWWSKLEDPNLCIRVDPIHPLTRQISTVLWANRTSQMMPYVMLTFEVWPAIGSWSKGCEEHMHEAYDGPQSTGLWIYFFYK